jgi:hypothetical protein
MGRRHSNSVSEARRFGNVLKSRGNRSRQALTHVFNIGGLCRLCKDLTSWGPPRTLLAEVLHTHKHRGLAQECRFNRTSHRRVIAILGLGHKRLSSKMPVWITLSGQMAGPRPIRRCENFKRKDAMARGVRMKENSERVLDTSNSQERKNARTQDLSASKSF